MENGSDMATKRVLVVEDDDALRDLVSMVLESEGFQVKAARHGREALRHLEGWIPDVILLDLMMPVMDGWSFCAERMHRPELARVPIVVMSAVNAWLQKKLPCTPLTVIPKPFRVDDLVHTVHRATSQTYA